MLLGVLVGSSAFFAQGALGGASGAPAIKSIQGNRGGGWGGPDSIEIVDTLGIDSISEGQFFDTREDVRFVLVESSSALSLPSPQTDLVPQGNGLMTYTVKEGDTLSHIAANFGISVDTILNANKSLDSTVIRPGQELMLLPVTGLLYEVKDDDTADSIAAAYGISATAILEANPDRRVVPGESIILPGVKPPQRSLYSLSVTGLPSYPGYYAMPAQGWNWGVLHPTNAVDIANACGTPIFASAEGLVVKSVIGGWNGGYGNYVTIEHPNGTQTRYSHTLRNAVTEGMYVNQGETISYIGNTGNTHGPTGCHIHFEIIGAKNPFAK